MCAWSRVTHCSFVWGWVCREEARWALRILLPELGWTLAACLGYTAERLRCSRGIAWTTFLGYERIRLPLHEVGLAAMGLCLLDNTDMEALADAVARFGKSDFLLCGAPLRIPGERGRPFIHWPYFERWMRRECAVSGSRRSALINALSVEEKGAEGIGRG